MGIDDGGLMMYDEISREESFGYSQELSLTKRLHCQSELSNVIIPHCIEKETVDRDNGRGGICASSWLSLALKVCPGGTLWSYLLIA